MKSVLERMKAIAPDQEFEHAALLEIVCEHTHDCIVLLDRDFNFIRVNQAYAYACRRDIHEFAGHNHFEFYPSPLVEDFEKVVATGIPFDAQARSFAFPDHPEWGETYWDLSLIPIINPPSDKISFLLFTLKDVTDRHRAELDLRKANRSLQVSSTCNALLVHAASETELLDGMCRVIVEKGGYLAARIGFDEMGDGQTSRPAAQFGNTSLFGGPGVTLPLGCCGIPYGVLTVHAAKQDAFGEDEIKLLEQLAGDLAYGIWGQRMRVAQKKTEEKLRQSEERYRLIVENAADAVMIVDPEGRFVYANQEAQKMLGYGMEELLRMSILDVTTTDEAEKVIGLFDALKTHGHVRDEIIKKKSDGRLFPVEVNAVRLPDGNYFGACRDVSERRRSNAALADSERKYRMLFENSRDALMQNAPPDWRFSSVNRAAMQLFGAKSEAEFMSLSPRDISPEFQLDGRPSAEMGKKYLAITLRKGHHLFEWMHKRLDGTLFPAEVLLTRMEWNGAAFILGSIRDISERKKLEKEILGHRNEMELLQKQQVASQTAAAFAHELNQPLMVISSLSEVALMLMNDTEPDFGQIRTVIEDSKRQALRAGHSIHQLLHLLNKQEVRTESMDLNEEITNILSIAITEHELQFHADLHLEENLPPVQANKTHVQKVLLNLLHNAIEAMGAAGVTLPEITVTVQEDGSVAQVTIRDNGPGFNPDDIRHLFEPFYTTKVNGIGMGLAISRALIEANGGQLWVDPEEGPGATFHLTLPFVS